MQDVSPTHGVPGDHGDDRLGQATDLDLQVGDVEAPHGAGLARLGEVARVPADVLVPAGAERLGALARQDDDADRAVLAGVGQGVGHLHKRLGAERVVHLGTVDRDLGDPVLAVLVAHVGEVLEAVDGGPRDVSGVLGIPDGSRHGSGV